MSGALEVTIIAVLAMVINFAYLYNVVQATHYFDGGMKEMMFTPYLCDKNKFAAPGLKYRKRAIQLYFVGVAYVISVFAYYNVM